MSKSSGGGQAFDVQSGLKIINEKNPDLLISDIELPDGTAFDLFKDPENITFNIIFVTAHSDYAIRAFKISAIDYLLKPLDINELQAAAKKAEEEMKKQLAEIRIKAMLENFIHNGEATKKIVLSINSVLHPVNKKETVYCKADGN
ncbi:MAG TPA: response regulator [Bacteroidales bacterium]|nr:response regulator [Bacteroidales bacterium]